MGWYIAGGIAAAILLLVALAVFFPRLFVRACFRPLLECLYSKRVVGAENLPAEGGYLLVSNHVSWIDGTRGSMRSSDCGSSFTTP